MKRPQNESNKHATELASSKQWTKTTRVQEALYEKLIKTQLIETNHKLVLEGPDELC